MKQKGTYLISLLIISYFILLFKDLIGELPHGIHEWAQADRLALAYGFYDNGMNFFKPSTYSQYSIKGITGVEFPVQAYIAAGIAKIMGREYLNTIFQILNLFIVGSGMIILYRMVFDITKNIITSIVPISFLLFSPVFLYYTCNYLPDAISTILAMIAMTIYIKCWLQEHTKGKFIAISLFTLASLIKTSSALYFIGFTSFDFLLIIYNKNCFAKRSIKLLLAVFVGWVFIIGYFLYNKHLNQVYESSLFLLNINPPSKGIISYLFRDRIPNVWLQEYFIMKLYGLLVLVFIVSFFTKTKRTLILYTPLLFILIIGIVIVSYLMGYQFVDHDYYVLPIFFPFIYFYFLFFTIHQKKLLSSLYGNITVAFLLLLFLSFTYKQFQYRISPDYPGFSDYYRTFWMEKSKEKLEKLDLAKDEKIVVINESAPNLSLVYFDRKGYVNKENSKTESFESLRDFFDDYGVRFGFCERQEMNIITQGENDFSKYFSVVYKDEKLTAFELMDNK